MDSKINKITKCRICGNKKFDTVLDLGNQYLSGFFPKKIDTDAYQGPLKLVKCDETSGGCGHVQLEHTFDLSTMYGEDYGYRSGLNGSMVKHLKNKYEKISNFLTFNDDDSMTETIVESQKVKPGDIVKLDGQVAVPADLILIYTSMFSCGK
jgi:NDP-4-keto-2,6-dideoxyhexose 3-C-methyltransferase